ncbi:MAG: hypothetical protein J5806_07740 [Lentisphaeria bacterium]|nr:hypothetical protein [Lentisphaeria bacterium]
MRLGTLFSDGAVLQQGQPVPVWGETIPGLLVKAEIAGKQAFARASADGDFRIQLPALPPGGPFELTVGSPENAAETVTVHDVMIGEVWLCSGQSNMYFKLGRPQPSDQLDPATPSVSRRQEKEFKERVREPGNFRFFTSPLKVTGNREKYCGGEWKTMTAENAPEASAAAAWFGLRLREELNVPVGLICCSWGGAVVETWTSPEALKTNPDTLPMIEHWEELRRQAKCWEPLEMEPSPVIRYAKPDDGNKGFGQGWAAPEFDDSAWKTMEVPGSWVEQGIGGNGAVWVRRKIELPASLAGHDLTLHLGGIDKHDITYFNGVEIGRTGREIETEHWDRPRSYRIPGELVKAGENTIAIRGFSFLYDGAFGGEHNMYHLTAADGTKIPVAGDWQVQVEYDRGKIASLTEYGIGNHNTPGLQFDSMVWPLIPYAIRGVLWYQGENNAITRAGSASYRKKLETMIRDWRFHWGLPDLPFIVVQLPKYHECTAYDEFSPWAVMRESQRAACAALPGVSLVCTLDAGEEKDIHPQDKKTVGCRLAAQAFYQVYGRRDRVPTGPEFLSVQREKDGALRVFFRFAEGMELRGEPGSSFYLAGEDGKYHPAESAEIDGDSIVLTSSAVKDPVSVRYAWSNNPNLILYNEEYPAPAFGGSIGR